MKTGYLYFLPAAMAVLSLAGCSNGDTPQPEKISDHPDFSAVIGGTQSRAYNDTWEENDQIGISCPGVVNICHILKDATSGSFTVKDADEQIYFQDGNKVTFTAYYPWNDLAEGVSVINANTLNQESQKSFDFLWAQAEGEKTSPEVTFTFGHSMSKLTLILKNGLDMDVSTIKSYKIDGLAMEGTFDVTSGICAINEDAEAEAISIDLTSVEVQESEMLPSLILFPQSVENKTVTLTLTDAKDLSYSCRLTFKEGMLTAGKNYRFTITVNKTGLTVNSNITDWNTVDEDDVQAR